MKTTLCFTLLTFVTLTFVPNSYAQDTSPEYVMRLIYFLPNDRQADPDIDTKLDTLIKDTQKFYADQMEAHGFGRKTFRFEADDAGDVVVHHVNGKFNDAYYQNPSTGSRIVWDEIEEQFDMSKNIYLLALDIDNDYLDGTGDVVFLHGQGSGNSFSGRVLIPASNFSLVLHEVGHAFGLLHDVRRDNDNAKWIYTSPTSGDGMISSFCAAEWLDRHRYFNPIQKDLDEKPHVQMLTPNFTALPATIRLRFEITDPDGLHQAQLFVPFELRGRIDYGLDYGLIACKKISGKSVTLEFITNRAGELVGRDTMLLRVMDVYGNFTRHLFPIEITDLVPVQNILIPDPNLALSIKETLALAPGNDITLLDMLGLWKLETRSRQITDLTGLEHAINIDWLELDSNQISDITPLTGLKKLTFLSLRDNPIRDITPLAGLTNLKSLHLSGTQVDDITPLARLSNLRSLYFNESKINDITPLTGLTNLVQLSLRHNSINDITPLTGLTNLRELDLAANSISDITPLAELTNLRRLGLHANQITDISIIARFTELRELFLSQMSNRDLTFLTNLTELRTLGLFNGQISDITPLAALTNLNRLWLGNNQINDVSSLAELVNLTELRLERNPIKNRKPLLALLQKNPDVKIYLKNGGEPLPVTLSHFRAEHTDAGVVLNWTTESEVDNAGFYIYRSKTKDGQFKVVNSTMIQGAGTTSERNTYTWADTTAKPNVAYYYRIEDISHAGVRKQLATVRMRGFVSASGKLTTRWADLKAQK